jgi:hypothetical protein
MRRTAAGLAVTALAALATAAPASANNEITDKCGSEDLTLPALVNRDVTIQAFDLCGADVRGTAGSGALRAMHATLRLAGDTAQRGSAAYWLGFATGPCDARLVYEDLVPPTGSGRALLTGQCGGTFKICQTQLPTEDCGHWVGGEAIHRVLPATASKLSGSTVTLDFDPGALPAHSVPQAFLDGFQPGRSLTALWASTWVRGQAGATEDDGVYWLMDQGSSSKPLALGGTRTKR